MLTIRATRKLLDRLGPESSDLDPSTTLLGDWYATALSWKPHQIALLMSERTLLPVLLPLAPAATLMTRLPTQLATVLTAHGVPDKLIHEELDRMRAWQLARTNDRSKLGSLNEFARLAEHARHDYPEDLTALSMWLATVPCSPLSQRHVSPDQELAALIQRHHPQGS